MANYITLEIPISRPVWDDMVEDGYDCGDDIARLWKKWSSKEENNGNVWQAKTGNF